MMIQAAGHARAPRAPHSLILSSGYSFVSGLLHWLVLTLTVFFLSMGTTASCRPRACLLRISHRYQIRTLFLVFLALSSCGQAAGFAVVQQQSTQSDEEPTTASITTAMTPRTDPQSWEALANATAAASTVSAITIHLSAHFVMGDYTREIHFGGKRLVIWGNNATLDAQKKGCFFSSGPGDDDEDDGEQHAGKTSLELHDLVMQNGEADQGVSGCFCVLERKRNLMTFPACLGAGIRTLFRQEQLPS